MTFFNIDFISPAVATVCVVKFRCWTGVTLHKHPRCHLHVPPALTSEKEKENLLGAQNFTTLKAFCPHSVFMCFVWISEQTAIISLYSINWLVFVTETECLLRGRNWNYYTYLRVTVGRPDVSSNKRLLRLTETVTVINYEVNLLMSPPPPHWGSIPRRTVIWPLICSAKC
jgi:hypothetical protein